MEKKIEYMKEEFQKINLELSEEQLQQFYQFYEDLIEKNKVMNLTGITEFDEVVQKHFIDSCIIHQYLPETFSMIDVGTGAGFPGIPLKIIFSENKFLLLDSLNKRINFLQEEKEKLGLDQLELVHGRAEETAKTANREAYDYAVSRAVANLATLCEYCLPFVKEGGYFISYKSGNVDEELNQSKHAISLLGGKLEKVEKFTLPGTDMERSFVFVKKIKPTPKRYPRKAGLPGKEPLK